jgi:5-formyltetrahydrofolate cyclo-ligase
LVPLLAFDPKGYRVGFGRGYYDKYLSLCKPDVIKIGLSYFEPVEVIDDVQDFDVPLSYCITTDNVYAF